MRLTRVSNAGLWVETRGLYILLDGLHGEAIHPYCGMDAAWEQRLFAAAPAADMLAFSHDHPDHFDPGRVCSYLAAHPKTGVYAGPDIIATLIALGVQESRLLSCEEQGPFGLSAFKTRHIGPKFRDTPHYSLMLRGDKTLLFTGDASPVPANFTGPGVPKGPDILAAPFAFAMGNAPMRVIEQVIRPKAVCILHLPLPHADPDNMRARTQQGAAGLSMYVKLMELGEALDFA